MNLPFRRPLFEKAVCMENVTGQKVLDLIDYPKASRIIRDQKLSAQAAGNPLKHSFFGTFCPTNRGFSPPSYVPLMCNELLPLTPACPALHA